MPEVVVVGAGPTGLALAGELALAGVDVEVLEKRAEEPNLTRAFAVHARTLELFDARGLADEVLTHGTAVLSVAPLGRLTVDLSRLDTRFGRIQLVPQSGTEKVLRAWAERLGATITTGAEVVAVRPDADQVELELGDGRTVSAQYVVGADGAHSKVRREAGIAFSGREYATHILLADVRMTEAEQALTGTTNTDGAALVVPFGNGRFRAIAWDRQREKVPLSEPVTGAELRDAFRRIAGTDYGMAEPTWTSRFLSERRQAAAYRAGRIFLAGDAAHVHSPLGGQGMNTGIQDAFNLGWKLAAAVRGGPDLLDTYQAERHLVGKRVLAMTDAFNRLVLGRGHKVRQFVLGTVGRLPGMGSFLAGRLSGIAIRYPRGRGDHRLVGTRMPDVDLPGGRLYERMRDGRFVLLDGIGGIEDGRLTVLPRQGRTVLVRPDGYVAWASDEPSLVEIRSALTRWLGSRVPSGDRKD